MVYDIDALFDFHQTKSDPAFQPAMNKKFLSADEFFGRTVEKYRQWLMDNTREQLDFVLLDLIRYSQNQIVLCDCHLTLEQADLLKEPSRIVFLLKEPSNLIEDYCNQADHQGVDRFINSASDPARAKAMCGETLKSLNIGPYERIKASRYFWLERDESSTIEETARKVEQHFSLA